MEDITDVNETTILIWAFDTFSTSNATNKYLDIITLLFHTYHLEFTK